MVVISDYGSLRSFKSKSKKGQLQVRKPRVPFLQTSGLTDRGHQ